MEGFIGKESCWCKQVDVPGKGSKGPKQGRAYAARRCWIGDGFRGNGGWGRRALMVEAD